MTSEPGFTVGKDLAALVTRHHSALRALVDDLEALELSGRRVPAARDWANRTRQLLNHSRPPRVARASETAAEPGDLSKRVRVAAVLRQMATDQDERGNTSAASLLRIAARELDVAERLLGSSTRDRT